MASQCHLVFPPQGLGPSWGRAMPCQPSLIPLAQPAEEPELIYEPERDSHRDPGRAWPCPTK
jgi:hypothetical protein